MAPSQRLTERINEALGVGPISPDALEFLVDGGVLVGAVGLEAESLCRAVPAIQRFGSALNTNVHFHTLVAQGVFVEKPDGTVRFVPAPAPFEVSVPGRTTSVPGRTTPTL